MPQKEYISKEPDMLEHARDLNLACSLDCPHVDKASGERLCSEPEYGSAKCEYYELVSKLEGREMNDAFEKMVPEEGENIGAVVKHLCTFPPPKR